MEHSRENAACCGGGGNLEAVDAELVGEIAQQRLQEISDTEPKRWSPPASNAKEPCRSMPKK